MASTVIDRATGVALISAIKAPCRVATTANIALYGEQTIDGVAVVSGDRVLVKNQTAAVENGIYIVDTGGWDRAPDFDSSRDVQQYIRVYVGEGTIGGGVEYVLVTESPVPGSTELEFDVAIGTALVPIYNTKALVSLEFIPPEITSIRTNGASATGDGDGGLYTTNDNGSADTVTSANGRVFWRVVDVTPKRISFGQTNVFGRSVGAGQGLPENYAPNNGSNFLAGIQAGKNATATRDLIAIGTGAASEGSKHFDCTFMGIDAGKYNEAKTHLYDQNQRQGSRNIAIGGNALRFNRSGFGITAIGRNAGQSVELPDDNTSSYIVALGAGALAGAAPIGLSGAIENWAPLNTSGAKATAIGVGALTAYSGVNATAVGSRALEGLKKGAYNVAVGDMALFALESGAWNNGGTKTDVNISGTYSQSGTTLTLSITAHGLAIGDIALFRLLDGGSQTFQNDIIPAYVVSVPSANTFTVTHPQSLTSSGTAILYSRVTGTASIAASENTAVGAEAGRNAASATGSSLFGRYAGYSATALDRSTLCGMMTGYSSSSLTTCSFLGYSAGRFDLAGAAVTGAMINRTALGYAAPTSGDNQVQLGNSSSTPYAYAALQIRSDRRDKANIRPTSLGLDFLLRVEPVEYQWDLREDYVADMPPAPMPPADTAPPEEMSAWHEALASHAAARHAWFSNPSKDGAKTRKRFHQGVIAQQVKEVADQLGVDFSGYQDHSMSGGPDAKTISYDAFIPIIIKAIQELKGEIENLKSAR